MFMTEEVEPCEVKYLEKQREQTPFYKTLHHSLEQWSSNVSDSRTGKTAVSFPMTDRPTLPVP
jgi:hypothetical protein